MLLLLKKQYETDVSSLEVEGQNNLLEMFKKSLWLFWCTVTPEKIRILHEFTSFVLCHMDTAIFK